MEIIIHGKPNAGSSKATSDINGLSQNIIDNFFREMDQIRGPESLVVDARYWQGTWYSIYTYVLGQNIKDTADRKSYFAISVVVPKSYYCLISEVYLQLKKVCIEEVIDSILSKNGKYIVQTLDDSFAFERIVSKVKAGFVNSNLEEIFDSNFERQELFRNDIYYNIVDCDSKAFVLCLKKHGRIIVTETEKTKDEQLAKTNDYIRQYNQAQTTIAEKDKQIEILNGTIEQLRKDLSEANSSTKGKVQKLQAKIDALITDNDNLSVEKEKLNDFQKDMREKVEKVADILGLTKSPTASMNRFSHVKDNPPSKSHKSSGNGWYNVIPLINTFLILLLMLLLLFNQKACSNVDKIVKPAEGHSSAFKAETIQSEEIGEEMVDSKECGLSIFTEGMEPLNGECVEVDIKQPIMLVLSNTYSNYTFHSDNLQNVKELKADTTITLKPNDINKPISIWYGSGLKNKANPKNVIIINIKK